MFSSAEKKPTISDSAALTAKLNHFFFRLEFLSSEWNVLFRNRYRGPAARSGRVRQSEVTVPLLKATCRLFFFPKWCISCSVFLFSAEPVRGCETELTWHDVTAVLQATADTAGYEAFHDSQIRFRRSRAPLIMSSGCCNDTWPYFMLWMRNYCCFIDTHPASPRNLGRHVQ